MCKTIFSTAINTLTLSKTARSENMSWPNFCLKHFLDNTNYKHTIQVLFKQIEYDSDLEKGLLGEYNMRLMRYCT